MAKINPPSLSAIRASVRKRWQIWAGAGLTLAVICAIMIVAMLGAEQERARYLRSFAETSTNKARHLGEHARQAFGHVDLALRSAKSLFDKNAQGKSSAALWRRSAALYRGLRRLAASAPHIMVIHIADSSGKIRHSSLRSSTRTGDVSSTPYFKALSKSRRRSHIGAAKLGGRKRTSVITVSRRLNDGRGRFIGVVTASISPAYFERLYGKGEQAGFTALITRDGTVLATSRREKTTGAIVMGSKAKTALFLKDLPALRLKNNQARDFATPRTVGAVFRVSRYNLRLAVLASRDGALARWHTDFWRRLIIVGVIGFLICGSLILAFWRIAARGLFGGLGARGLVGKASEPLRPKPRRDPGHPPPTKDPRQPDPRTHAASTSDAGRADPPSQDPETEPQHSRPKAHDGSDRQPENTTETERRYRKGEKPAPFGIGHSKS